TDPAAGQARYVVSNRLVTDLWGPLGVQQWKRDELTEPPGEADAWLTRVSEDRPNPVVLEQLLPQFAWQNPPASIKDLVGLLERVATTRYEMNDGARALIQRDPAIAVMMMHVASFDEICHAFWQYRFPEDFPNDPPPAADVTLLGPVIDRYLEVFDKQLGDLIAAFPEPPNVLIVADHGEGPAMFHTIWRGWHTSPGMFLAAGPDIPHETDIQQVSYYDITPTVRDL